MVVSADPQQRYAGVGILISNRVAAPDDISYTSSLPGRLLHVRCTTTGKTLDVIAGYQWVRTEGGTAASTEKRSKFWMMAMDRSQEEMEENKETAEDERRPKWAKPASKGGKGAGNKATQDLMSQMVRAMLRHEAEIQRLKQDLGYMVFIDTSGLGCLPVLRRVAENWQDQYTKGTVTSPLRLVMFLAMLETLKTTAEETLADEEKLQRCMNVGWTVAGENALSPKWVYHSWDPAAKKQIVATDPPISHAEALRLVDQLMKHAPQEGVLKNFKTTRRLTAQDQYKAEVLPFIVSIGLRGESSAICFNALLLSGSAIMKLIGVRIRPERGQEPQLIKQLKQSYMGTTFCEWTKKQTQWGGDA
ncbi:unnamed protein product [Symbiodinium sp. KB8]|nr:unnamed protein product [Symbiodinium sp. KB8]